MNKIYLYIDTSAFKAISFNLNHPSMKLIKRGVDDNLIVILTNMILEGEIASHCKEAIENEKIKINNSGVLDSFFHVALDKLRSAVEDGNVDLFQKTFRYDFLPKNIDREIDYRVVFEKYFNKLLPFSDKKKTEFPDAFVIEMLQAYLGQNLHIVSGDNDFHQWAEQAKSVTAYRSVREFADLFEKSIAPHKKIIEIYKNKKSVIAGQIKTRIKKYYSKFPDFLSEGYSKVVSAYVQEVSTPDIAILSLNQSENAIGIGYRAQGKVSVEVERLSLFKGI